MTTKGGLVALAPHAAVLLCLHLLVQLMLGSGWWIIDESVYLQQSQWLTEGHWTEAIPEASFGGTKSAPVIALPINHGTVVNSTDWIIYPRHPAYPKLLSVSLRMFGNFGPPLVSILAAVSASILIGLSVSRNRRVAFWLSALGTAMFFHAHIVWAHSIGMAAAALTTLALVRHIRNSPDKWSTAGLVVGLVLVSLFRTEGLIFSIAVVIVIGIDWLCCVRSWRSLTGPAAAVFGLLAGAGIDTWWRSTLLEGRMTAGSSVNLGAISALERMGALATMAFGTGLSTVGSLGRIGLVLCIAVGARHSSKGHRIPAAAFALPTLCGVAAFDSPAEVGLFIAAPLVLLGLLKTPLNRESIALLLLAALSLLGVVGTMYAADAGRDFGGRLFLMVLPALVIVAVPGLVKFTKDQGTICLTAFVLVVLPQQAGIMSDVSRSFDATNEARSEVISFADSHVGATLVAVDLATAHATWDVSPLGLVTATGETTGPYLEGNENDEVWILAVGIGQDALATLIPPGWVSVAEYLGDYVDAIQIEPTDAG